MNDPKSAIDIEDVSKRFGRTTAVARLSLRVSPGRVVGFLGPNGAGKTTTIKMLMGLLRADSGRNAVLGLDPATAATQLRSKVGYVPEQQFIPRWMRVDESITFCRTFYPTWNDKLCDELVHLFGLDPRKKMRALSKGTQTKLALVLALAHNPDLLILDEPMAGLDPLTREELLNGVLRTICEQPRTILFSSHTFADVQRLADEVAIIHEGRLLVHCNVAELLEKTKRLRAVLADGCAADQLPENTIWQRRNGREWLITVRDFSADTIARIQNHSGVESVEVIDLSLEEIFKDIIRGQRSELCT